MAKKYTHKPFQQIQRCIVLTKKLIRIYLFIFITAQASGQTITSFSPLSAAVGTSVTIAGSGFNTTATNNIVFFGATRATVTSASSTSLTVTVPSGATHAPITVLNTSTSLMAYSTAFFFPTFTPNKDTIATTDIAPRVDYIAGGLPRAIAISDFDGDGKPDLAVANISTSQAYTPDTVSVFRNTTSSGNITFAPKLNFVTAGNNRSLTIADIDGDGKPDIISLLANDAKISVLRNTSTPGNITFAPAIHFNLTNLTGTATSIAVGELNGDGKPEVVVVGGSAIRNVAIFRNQSTPGTISFASDVYFEVSTGPRFVGIGDINGDSKPDIVTVSDGFGVVSVLRNTTTTAISFATTTDFTISANPFALAIGDLNGDGMADVAVANNILNVFVLRNTSTTSALNFATPVSYSAGTSPTSVAIADLNGDGKLDLGVANGTSHDVSLLRNTSTGSMLNFASAVNISGPQPPSGIQPLSLAIGDLNADGKPDLVTANSYFNSGNTISVFRNDPKIPEIIKSGSLTNFSACTGNVSVPQSFSIRGINLVANISVTAPSGFEISTNQTSGYTSSITLARTADSVATTVLYVRMSSTASSTPSGSITCTSTWAATQNLPLNGLVKVPTSSTSNLSICPSALPYVWNGLTFTAAGTQTKTGLTNAVGCDSSATLNLTIKSTSSSTTNVSICPSDLPYVWNGLTFTAAGTQTKTGFTNAVGCDSSATLNLTVKSTSSSTTNVSICPSDLPYVWNGLTFTAAGTKTKTGFTNAVGCDSSATLNLTVKSTSSSTTNLSICPSDLPYVWNGLTFTSAGTQTKTGFTNAVGCDSSATL
ncbi:MAG: FG-GAP-like repeat-containing protein, partial [Bacteroidota bacterium]